MLAALFGSWAMAKRGDRSTEKEAFWKLAVEEWRAAGTTIREFCRSNGLRESAFYFWRRELAKRSGAPTAEPGSRSRRRVKPVASAAPAAARSPGRAASPTAMFLPLALRSTELAVPDAGGIEIVVGDHRIRLSAGFDEETLTRLLRLLATAQA